MSVNKKMISLIESTFSHEPARSAAMAWADKAAASRPWPIIALTLIGTLFSTLPLAAALGIAFKEIIESFVGAFTIGALLTTGAVIGLKRFDVSLYFEQVFVVMLGLGVALIGYAFIGPHFDHLRSAALVLLGLSLLLAFVINRGWLSNVFGLVAALFLSIAIRFVDDVAQYPNRSNELTSIAALLLIWLGMLSLQSRLKFKPHFAALCATLEYLSTGWALYILIILLESAAPTWHDASTSTAAFSLIPVEGIQLLWAVSSLVLTLLAAVWLLFKWPSLRSPLRALMLLPLAVLAWVQPLMGFAALPLAVAATKQNWPLAATCALTMLALISRFYYQLQWPLVTKAAVMAGVGLLMLLTIFAAKWLKHERTQKTQHNQTTAPQSNAPSTAKKWAYALIASCAAASLGVINYSIAQKENIIANGKPALIEIAPVDPRSIMQGDYMALNFKMLDNISNWDFHKKLQGQERLFALATQSSNGVIHVTQVDTHAALLAIKKTDEFLIQLTKKNSRWLFVTDAWYFREGDGEKWAKAKYGDFRVLPNGTALLVGMRDAALQPIVP